MGLKEKDPKSQLYSKNFKCIDSITPGQTADLQSMDVTLGQTEHAGNRCQSSVSVKNQPLFGMNGQEKQKLHPPGHPESQSDRWWHFPPEPPASIRIC